MRHPAHIRQILDPHILANLLPFDRLVILQKLLLFQQSASSIQPEQPEHCIMPGVQSEGAIPA